MVHSFLDVARVQKIKNGTFHNPNLYIRFRTWTERNTVFRSGWLLGKSIIRRKSTQTRNVIRTVCIDWRQLTIGHSVDHSDIRIHCHGSLEQVVVDDGGRCRGGRRRANGANGWRYWSTHLRFGNSYGRTSRVVLSNRIGRWC